MLFVTGGAGFIGTNFIVDWLAGEGTPVVNLDKLTYAGNLANLESVKEDKRHTFVQGDINDRPLVRSLLKQHAPRAIVHFAAESHVDRSIVGPSEFIETNIVGTFNLLEETRAYWSELSDTGKGEFRFLHVSTDEVYGSLGPQDPPFTEETRYAPSSPYAASKAASDHLVRAYHETYGLPTLTTNCSNNYGPYQFPEKLIPLMIVNAIRRDALPVYGSGWNIRDWLYVGDHCAGIRAALNRGRVGETYHFGGQSEIANIDLVHTLCKLLDELHPASAPHAELIRFVADRPGHDHRYAMNTTKARDELRWSPAHTLEDGLRGTVQWYLQHGAWVESVTSAAYRTWLAVNYGERLSGARRRIDRKGA